MLFTAYHNFNILISVFLLKFMSALMQVRVRCCSTLLLGQTRVDKLQHNLAVIFHHIKKRRFEVQSEHVCSNILGLGQEVKL